MLVVFGTCSILLQPNQIYLFWDLIKSFTALLDESFHFQWLFLSFLQLLLTKTKKTRSQSPGIGAFKIHLNKCLIVWLCGHSKKSSVLSALFHGRTTEVFPNLFLMTLKAWHKICWIGRKAQFDFSSFWIEPKGSAEQLDEDQPRKQSLKTWLRERQSSSSIISNEVSNQTQLDISEQPTSPCNCHIDVFWQWPTVLTWFESCAQKVYRQIKSLPSRITAVFAVLAHTLYFLILFVSQLSGL